MISASAVQTQGREKHVLQWWKILSQLYAGLYKKFKSDTYDITG